MWRTYQELIFLIRFQCQESCSEHYCIATWTFGN